LKIPCKTTTFSCWSEYSEIEPPKTFGAMLCNAVDDVLDGLGWARGRRSWHGTETGKKGRSESSQMVAETDRDQRTDLWDHEIAPCKNIRNRVQTLAFSSGRDSGRNLAENGSKSCTCGKGPPRQA